MKQLVFMNRLYRRNKNILEILGILLLWRIYLIIVQTISFQYPSRKGYLGFIPEANFDGVFYLNISEYWYRGLDQAFFPMYPIFIKVLTYPTSIPPAGSGIIVSIFSLIILTLVFKKLVDFDGFKKYSIWVVAFLLAFPTSFFFASIYTESLFLAFVMLSFYFTRKEKLFPAVVFAILATATRIVGIFLLPSLLFEVYLQMREKKKRISLTQFLKKCWILFLAPIGLICYMGFLWYKYADPLLFVHIQPAFGAGRSGGEIILLPQVLYRYAKIIITVPYTSQTFLISVFELITFLFISIILFFSIKKGIRKSYILFSACALVFPTVSGTLSSLPRYALMSFVVFIFLGSIKSKYTKIAILSVFLFLQTICAILFLRGYFIS